MKGQLLFVYILIFSQWISSCGIVHQGYDTILRNGDYRQGQKRTYVQVEEKAISIYPILANDNVSNDRQELLFQSDTTIPKILLTQNSFDLDLIYIPFKFRFSRSNVPVQLNSTINTAVYTGFRRDFHLLKYKRKRTGESELEVSNTGLSIGLFNGISNADINASTTNGKVALEYDGVVWMYGINVVLGWNKVTLGLALGNDFLLDKNRSYWIYNRQLWLGVTLGLNLN